MRARSLASCLAVGRHELYVALRSARSHVVPTMSSFTKVDESLNDRVAQRDAVRSIEAALFRDSHDFKDLRATVVMPGGSGKTRVGMRSVELALKSKDEASSVALVLVPRLALLEQTVREYMMEGRTMLQNWTIQALCVCSSLAENTITHTTHPDTIAEWLSSISQTKLMFATYASVEAIEIAQKSLGKEAPIFSIVVLDEAHFTAGLGEDSARSLSNTHILAKRRLFLTATPRLLGTDKLSFDAGVDSVRSMDDIQIYGKTVFALKRSEAIAQGITVPVKLVVVERRQSTSSLFKPSVAGDPQDDADASFAVKAMALQDFCKRHRLKKIVSFSRTNSRSRQLHRAALSLGTFDCLIVDGKMRAKEREAALSRAHADNLSLKPVVISNAKLLTEGFDLPTCDGVFLADEMESHVTIQQAMARAARCAEGKNCGYVCVPIGEETFMAPGSSPYKAVRAVLLAMLEDDEFLLKDLRRWAEYVGERTKQSDDNFELPDSIRELILLPKEANVRELQKSIETVILDLLGTWDQRFGCLKRFKEIQGNCNVPTTYVTEEGVELGLWVKNQRAAFSNKRLSEDRIHRLEEIDFVWDVLDHEWASNFEMMKEYVVNHGDAMVPNTYATTDGFTLGRWVRSQRDMYSKGKMSKDRVWRLEELGFIWDVPALEWNNNVELLEKFRRENGDCMVKKNYVTGDGVRLGAWIGEVRNLYANGKLSEKRIRRLNGIGFVFDVFAVAWIKNFELLERFYESEGHSNVSPSYVTEDGTHLGRWIIWQRKCFGLGKLCPVRTNRLKELDFVFETDFREDEWNRHMEALVAYKLKFGDTLVPKKFINVKGIKIGRWVSVQREYFVDGRISDNRVLRLNKIGFIWKVIEAEWEKMFSLLKRYHMSYGNCDTRTLFEVDGVKLGRWANRQRLMYSRGKLKEDQVRRLEELGFSWTRT